MSTRIKENDLKTLKRDKFGIITITDKSEQIEYCYRKAMKIPEYSGLTKEFIKNGMNELTKHWNDIQKIDFSERYIDILINAKLEMYS